MEFVTLAFGFLPGGGFAVGHHQGFDRNIPHSFIRVQAPVTPRTVSKGKGIYAVQPRPVTAIPKISVADKGKSQKRADGAEEGRRFCTGRVYSSNPYPSHDSGKEEEKDSASKEGSQADKEGEARKGKGASPHGRGEERRMEETIQEARHRKKDCPATPRGISGRYMVCGSRPAHLLPKKGAGQNRHPLDAAADRERGTVQERG